MQNQSTARYVVGIDLGTTHCVVASSPVTHNHVTVLPIAQLVAPEQTQERMHLPSFAYIPTASEVSAHDSVLTHDELIQKSIVGEYARTLGSQAPTRSVASAKSWICHGGVNRKAAILPWSAPDTEPHLSPYAAQVLYLKHLAQAWQAKHPDAPLHAQDVVVTVPASFDESAKELTTLAAREAQLGEVRLIEEPQAAFYDYLGHVDAADEAFLKRAKLILVVDVGGGTTDLTLLRIEQGEAHEPQFERIAVGGHLLLGGDNMDAAVAHYALKKLNVTRTLEASEWASLMQAARSAKELLLSDTPPQSTSLALRTRGSKLLAGTLSTTLTQAEVHTVLLDGFFPFTASDDLPTVTQRAALTTLGLPYAHDAAIPRHICAFLRRHADAAAEAGAKLFSGMPQPDAVLLNGGVFNAPKLGERLAEVMTRWFEGHAVPYLKHTSLEASVACGAARYALARRGIGKLITGGSPRAYYIGIDTKHDGVTQPRALCVAPRGMDENSTVDLPNQLAEVAINQKVMFSLYSYTGSRVDAPGTLIAVDAELETLPPLIATLRKKHDGGKSLSTQATPVSLSATYNERSELELYLTTLDLPPERWRLLFNLQPEKDAAPKPPSDKQDEEAPHPQLPDALKRVVKTLESAAPDDMKGLRSVFEDKLGPRGQWTASTCRAIADAMLPHFEARRKNAEAELSILRLLGWCLRPGYGYADDAARIAKLLPYHDELPVHRDKSIWSEWWIFWRRIAQGLPTHAQQALFERVRPWFDRTHPLPANAPMSAKFEMLQLLAVLEGQLTDAETSASLKDILADHGIMSGADTARIHADALPLGLRLR